MLPQQQQHWRTAAVKAVHSVKLMTIIEEVVDIV
jgi:hypothetical protein